MKNKENAKPDFLEMIKHSWTYERLTQKEKEIFEKLFEYHPTIETTVSGDYDHRWRACQALYLMFLAGCGYNNQVDWREEK